jgi:hypothetical protein
MSKTIECDSGESFELSIVNGVFQIKRSEQCGYSVAWLTYAEARELATELTALLDEYLAEPRP